MVMVGGAVVTPVSLASVPKLCAPPAACAGVCGGTCGRPCQCCEAVAELLPSEGHMECAEIEAAPMFQCRVPEGSYVLGGVSPVRA